MQRRHDNGRPLEGKVAAPEMHQLMRRACPVSAAWKTPLQAAQRGDGAGPAAWGLPRRRTPQAPASGPFALQAAALLPYLRRRGTRPAIHRFAKAPVAPKPPQQQSRRTGSPHHGKPEKASRPRAARRPGQRRALPHRLPLRLHRTCLHQRLKPRHSLVADTAQGACGHNHAQQHRRPQPVKEPCRQPLGQQALQQRNHRRKPRTRQRERQHHPKHLTHGRPPPGTIWPAAPRCRFG